MSKVIWEGSFVFLSLSPCLLSMFWRSNRCSLLTIFFLYWSYQFEYWHSAMCQFILNDLPSYQSPVVIPVCCNHIFKPQGYSSNTILIDWQNEMKEFFFSRFEFSNIEKNQRNKHASSNLWESCRRWNIVDIFIESTNE